MASRDGPRRTPFLPCGGLGDVVTVILSRSIYVAPAGPVAGKAGLFLRFQFCYSSLEFNDLLLGLGKFAVRIVCLPLFPFLIPCLSSGLISGGLGIRVVLPTIAVSPNISGALISMKYSPLFFWIYRLFTFFGVHALSFPLPCCWPAAGRVIVCCLLYNHLVSCWAASDFMGGNPLAALFSQILQRTLPPVCPRKMDSLSPLLRFQP